MGYYPGKRILEAYNSWLENRTARIEARQAADIAIAEAEAGGGAYGPGGSESTKMNLWAQGITNLLNVGAQAGGAAAGVPPGSIPMLDNPYYSPGVPAVQAPPPKEEKEENKNLPLLLGGGVLLAVLLMTKK